MIYSDYSIYRRDWAIDRAQQLKDEGIDVEIRKSYSWYEIWVSDGTKEQAWNIWRNN